MAMYTKPMPYKDFIEMMGEPTEEDLKENKRILEQRKKQKVLDAEYGEYLTKQEDADIDGAIAAMKRANTGLPSKNKKD